MDNFAHLFQGFAIAFTPVNLLMALVGAFMGIVVGLCPASVLWPAAHCCCL